MKERPILFSGPMVRAILDGRKTQTRRIVKVPWKGSTKTTPYEPYYVDDGGVLMVGIDGPYRPFVDVVASPYGVIGDRLWVRETWCAWSGGPTQDGEEWDEVEGTPEEWHSISYRADDKHHPSRWRPSIHMPRWASRITLEVTGVRVERLQDISEDDATAEGFEASYSWAGHAIMVEDGGTFWQGEMNPTPLPKVGDMSGGMRVVHVQPTPRKLSTPARDLFANTWRNIHGADSWSANPWVWVIEFRRP